MLFLRKDDSETSTSRSESLKISDGLCLLLMWSLFILINTYNLGTPKIPSLPPFKWKKLEISLPTQVTQVYFFTDRFDLQLEVSCGRFKSEEDFMSGYALMLVPYFFPACKSISFLAKGDSVQLRQIRFLNDQGEGVDPTLVCIDGSCNFSGLQNQLFEEAVLMDSLIESHDMAYSSPLFDEIISIASALQLGEGLVPRIAKSHPLWGRWLLGQVFQQTGYSPFVARFYSLFWASLIPVLAFLLIFSLSSSNRVASWLAFFLTAINPLLLSLGRIALFDTKLAFWILLSLLLVLYGWRSSSKKACVIYLISSAISVGLAASVKVSGFFLFPILYLGLFAWNCYKFKFLRWEIGILLILLPTLVAATYFGHFYLMEENLRFQGDDGLSYTITAFNRHAHYRSNPVPGTSPLQWIIGIGGIGVLIDMTQNRQSYASWGIVPIGLMSFLAILSGIYVYFQDRNRQAILFLIMFFLAYFLPWFIIPRSFYVYHFLPSSIAMGLLCVLALDILRKSKPWLFGILIGLFCLNFAFFIPVIYRIPLHDGVAKLYSVPLTLFIDFSKAFIADR